MIQLFSAFSETVISLISLSKNAQPDLALVNGSKLGLGRSLPDRKVISFDFLDGNIQKPAFNHLGSDLSSNTVFIKFLDYLLHISLGITTVVSGGNVVRGCLLNGTYAVHDKLPPLIGGGSEML